MAGRHVRRPEGPVFVDPSGRRSLAVRSVGWVVAALVAGYLLLVAIALVGPPGLSRVTVPGVGPVLPGPGAAGLDDGGSQREAPQAVLERTPSPRPAATRTSLPTRAPATTAPATPATPTSPSAGSPPGRPTPTGTAEATPAPRRTGRPTEQPARSDPPGASRRPTKSPS